MALQRLLAAVACLAAAAAALRLSPISSRISSQRSTWLVAAQSGWITAVDEASGQPYWYNEQTGQSQWEKPPQLEQYAQQDYGSNQEVITYISERLQEPQIRIVRAVVDFLGTEVAYQLLDQTEQIQVQGGMIVPETGRPRTSGGIYLQLLKDATYLPPEAQEAALLRIKQEGKGVKSWDKALAPSAYRPY